MLGPGRKYGAARVEAAGTTALAAEMLSVRRRKAMLEHAAPVPPALAPPARSLRPALQYALPLVLEPSAAVDHGH